MEKRKVWKFILEKYTFAHLTKKLIMKKIIPAILLVASVASLQAQDQEAMELQKKIFKQATSFNDLVVARVALHNMLAMDPSNNDLLDSLAVFYLEYGQYASAALAANEAKARNPDNVLALEIAALSFENLHIKDRALSEYESLFLKNNNSFTLYKIAFLQYDLERYNESNTSADILLRRTEVEEQTVSFQKNDKTQQQVPLKAALYNLKGIIAGKQEDKEKAREFFNKALETAPDFELAKLNLEDVDKEE